MDWKDKDRVLQTGMRVQAIAHNGDGGTWRFVVPGGEKRTDFWLIPVNDRADEPVRDHLDTSRVLDQVLARLADLEDSLRPDDWPSSQAEVVTDERPEPEPPAGPPNLVLPAQHAAELIDVPIGKLIHWMQVGIGPKFRKTGKGRGTRYHILYSDLMRWHEAVTARGGMD